ncbi:hypothetical protein [Pseudomonas rhodesiae]|uniref:hypothetical protein n=1 Tax=Pseudomonas rhodesiae TaxID=76760 RepID=UPI001FC8EFB3|nr:hypothetical protein [Pseudomonas rhodesiae]
MKLEIALYQALASINVPEPKINAVIDAMESDLNTALATKADIANLKQNLRVFMVSYRKSKRALRFAWASCCRRPSVCWSR